MLREQVWRYRFDPADQVIFDKLLPAEHPLLDALELIPWDRLGSRVEQFYSVNKGQPAYLPLLMLKLEFLRYQYNLSDRQVIERAQTDVVFRWFLQIPARCRLPDSSSLTRFRGRLGNTGFKAVFDELVKCAREAGLVKDRLRLKDASHVIAKIAVPTTLKLFAQLRDQLLEQLALFECEAATGFQLAAEQTRETTREAAADVRLESRVKLVEDVLACIDSLPAPSDAKDNRAWQRLCELRDLGRKLLDEQANPDAVHRTLSVVDPDARRGKHGQWYEGYVLDVMIDADSEVITQLQLLQAGGDEARSCVALVQQEQETHGNRIQEVSIDGAGFNGPMLQSLEDQLGVSVVTPPKEATQEKVFPSSKFQVTEDGLAVICPAGKQSPIGSEMRVTAQPSIVSRTPPVTTVHWPNSACLNRRTACMADR